MRRAISMGLMIVAMAGCNSEAKGPPLSPAKGVAKGIGGIPMTGGTLEFTPAEGTAGSAVADIQPDGTFTIYTIVEGQRRPGAMVGNYVVTVIPPGVGEKQMDPITLIGTTTIKEGENNLAFDVPIAVPRK